MTKLMKGVLADNVGKFTMSSSHSARHLQDLWDQLPGTDGEGSIVSFKDIMSVVMVTLLPRFGVVALALALSEFAAVTS